MFALRYFYDWLYPDAGRGVLNRQESTGSGVDDQEALNSQESRHSGVNVHGVLNFGRRQFSTSHGDPQSAGGRFKYYFS